MRVSSAPFVVHRHLRGREDRSKIMADLSRKAKDGHVTEQAVRSWIGQHTSTTRKTAKPGPGSWETAVQRFIRRNCVDDDQRRRAIELIAEGAPSGSDRRWSSTAVCIRPKPLLTAPPKCS